MKETKRGGSSPAAHRVRAVFVVACSNPGIREDFLVPKSDAFFVGSPLKALVCAVSTCLAGCYSDSPVTGDIALRAASAGEIPAARGAEYAADKKLPRLKLVDGRIDADPAVNGIMGFEDLSSTELLSVGQQGDSIFSLGIKRPGERRGFWKGRSLVDKQGMTGAARSVAGMQGVSVVFVDTILPLLRVKIADTVAIRRLRALPFVDYLEPAQRLTTRALFSNSGCGWGSNEAETEFSTTYGTYPRSFTRSNVHRAWATGLSGAGVRIGVTDTGVLPSNYEFANFSSGLSTAAGRSFTQEATISGSVECPHGTKFASVLAAPRNGLSITGVAWNAAVHSTFMSTSPFLLVGEDAWHAIRNAGASGAKVISMAWGGLFWWNATADEIVYWHTTLDVAFVGAAGTSDVPLVNHDWVVFPARMAEVLAVSAANPDGTRDSESHYGPQLDVVAYGKVTSTDEGGLGLSSMANSSGATAVVTGVVALMRERFPFLNSEDLYARIRTTAGTACGPWTAFGPVLNALPAVGGFCDSDETTGMRDVFFTSQDDSPVAILLTAPAPRGNAATFLWSDGATSRERYATVSPQAINAVTYVPMPWVTVTDLRSGEVKVYAGEFRVTTGDPGAYCPPGGYCQ